MFTSKVLISKRFAIEDVKIEHTQESNWSIDHEMHEIVAKERERKITARSISDKPLWDGDFYRIENIGELNNNVDPIVLQLNTIKYRYINTMNTYIQYYKEKPVRNTNHLSTAGMLLTADGKYIFGERAWNGAIDPIGGGTQPEELAIMNGIDLKNNLYKEIKEETGITHEQIASCEGVGFLFSYKSNILLIADVQLNIDQSKAIEMFKKRKDDEMRNLVFVDKSSIHNYMKPMKSYRPLIPGLL